MILVCKHTGHNRNVLVPGCSLKNLPESNVMVDYSKWAHIDVSDDEDDTHPNIDTPSLYRWRHQARVERMDEQEKEKERFRREADEHQKRLEQLKKLMEETESKGMRWLFGIVISRCVVGIWERVEGCHDSTLTVVSSRPAYWFKFHFIIVGVYAVIIIPVYPDIWENN